MHFAVKYISQFFFSLRPIFNLFLIFRQISGSCSYKVVLIKGECNLELENDLFAEEDTIWKRVVR